MHCYIQSSHAGRVKDLLSQLVFWLFLSERGGMRICMCVWLVNTITQQAHCGTTSYFYVDEVDKVRRTLLLYA